jgi:hypothetical protein
MKPSPSMCASITLSGKKQIPRSSQAEHSSLRFRSTFRAAHNFLGRLRLNLLADSIVVIDHGFVLQGKDLAQREGRTKSGLPGRSQKSCAMGFEPS